MFSSLLHFGWSNTLAQHMLRVYKVQKFCSFDFGAERNMKMFGQSEPLDYLKMFDKIDIPVTTICRSRTTCAGQMTSFCSIWH